MGELFSVYVSALDAIGIFINRRKQLKRELEERPLGKLF